MYNKPFRGAILNRSHPLARGIVLAWLMNDYAGIRVFDSVLNGNIGTLYNGPIWAGQGIRFDGSNDYLQVPLPPQIKFGSPISVVMQARLLNAGLRGMFNVQEAVGEGGAILVGYWDQTNSRISIAHNRVAAYSRRTNTLTDLTLWRQITVTHSGPSLRASMNIYIDGSLNQVDVGDSLTDWGSNKVEVAAGYNYNSAYMANCDVAYFYVYNRVLTATEIAQLSLNPYAMYEQPSRAKYFYVAAGGVALSINVNDDAP